jgi:amidophosphoribosyltransferase
MSKGCILRYLKGRVYILDELRKLKSGWGNYYNEGADEYTLKLKEECGVFGVYGHPAASSLTYYGLHALQHRGEESAGICTLYDDQFLNHRGMGLVKEVFNQEKLSELKGSTSIGHVRYSTAGGSTLENAQPLVSKYHGGNIAVCTNGNLVNAVELRKKLEASGSIFQTTSDTEVIIHLIAHSKQTDITLAIKEALQQVIGGFAFLIMVNDRLYVALDRNGLRPLVMGRYGDAYVFASETCALDTVGATYVRDILPGELLIIDSNGLHVERFTAMEQKALCVMEFVYFSRPDSNLNGINVHLARKRMGRQLALESFVEADIVTGVPDSSLSAAMGYAEATGIPNEMGLIKNRYMGRTFIQPSQEMRENGVKMKLSAVRKVVEGKRVVMIDDSIVRGTTSRRIVNLLRQAGAKEVHVLIASPPYIYPCFYGIDTPDRNKLIAATHSVEEIKRIIQADSLHYLSENGMIEAIGLMQENSASSGVCACCFDQKYPTKLSAENIKSLSFK